MLVLVIVDGDSDSQAQAGMHRNQRCPQNIANIFNLHRYLSVKMLYAPVGTCSEYCESYREHFVATFRCGHAPECWPRPPPGHEYE